ncbi:MAG: RNA polymerase sigma factor [Bacteroidia bacterium]
MDQMTSQKINREEQALIKSCVENDRLAQKTLFEKYKRAMYTICYQMLGNTDDAHDALQEGFINVFKSIRSFSGRGTLGSWIKTIIIRSAIKQLDLTSQTIDIDYAVEFEAPQWPNDIDGEILEKAITLLPEKCRVVFLLIEVEEYSHKEVAEMLGIGIGTSKSQLHYAKKLLCEKLKHIYA